MKYVPVLIALALFGVLLLQWLDWPPPPPMSAPSSETGVPEPVAPPARPDLLARLETSDDKTQYAAIIERPLFRPDRKPEPASDEPAGTLTPEDNAELSAFDLNAVLITPQVVSAWVKDPAQPKLRRLRIGDDLQGWSVLDILEDRVLLERQGQRDALLLRDYGQTPSPSAPPPARKVLPRPPPRAPVRAEPPKQ